MLILYTTEDGRSQLHLHTEHQAVCLSQAELFETSRQNVSVHLKNIFEDGELDATATVKESLTVQTEGNASVPRTGRR